MELNTPMDFVRYIEHTQGVMNIYDNELRPKVTNERLWEDLYLEDKELFDQLYGSPEEAKEGIRQDFDREHLARMFYQPQSLSWAQEKAKAIMGSDWLSVDFLPVSTVTVPVFNAAAVRCNQAFDVILFNIPLIMLLPNLNDTLWTVHKQWMEIQWNDLPLLRSELSRRLGYVLHPTFGGFDFQFTQDQAVFRFTSMSTNLQILFILLHEYAHVVLGHLDATALSMASPLNHNLSGVKYYTQSQEQEFEADRKACSWLFDSPVDLLEDEEIRLSSDIYEFVPWSVVFLFTLFSALDQETVSLSDTHPPAWERLKFVRDAVSQSLYYGDSISLVDDLIHFFQAFLTCAQQNTPADA